MADTAIRIRAGQTVSETFTPASTEGTWTATARDPLGRNLSASAEVSGSNIIVTINAQEWKDGRSGIGRLEVKNVTGNTTTFPITRQLRILPGIEADGTEDGYSWSV